MTARESGRRPQTAGLHRLIRLLKPTVHRPGAGPGHRPSTRSASPRARAIGAGAQSESLVRRVRSVPPRPSARSARRRGHRASLSSSRASGLRAWPRQLCRVSWPPTGMIADTALVLARGDEGLGLFIVLQSRASRISRGAGATQLHGVIGVTREHDCHLYYRRAHHLSRALGSPQWWKDRVFKKLARPSTSPVSFEGEH